MLTRLSSINFSLKFLMLIVLGSFTCTWYIKSTSFNWNMEMKHNTEEYIHQWVSNFSMPKDIINYNKTSNPHLQQ